MPILRDIVEDATTDSLARRKPADHSILNARHPADDGQSSPYASSSLDALQPRTITTVAIPTYYRVDGPGAGTVVGIVLGSVAGFLLIVWLLFSLTQGGGFGGGGATIAAEEEIVVRRPRRHSHGNYSRRSTRTEMRDYGGSSPRRSGGSRSQVIVEERRRPRSVVVEERTRVRGDDEVVVIEESDSDYHPRRPRRNSRYS